VIYGKSVVYIETGRVNVTGTRSNTCSNSTWIMVAWFSVSSNLLTTNHLTQVPIH